MAGNTKGPRIVDLLAEIARELWLSNRMRALTLGATVLEHSTTSRAATPQAKARVDKKNELRRKVRVALELEEQEAKR